MGLAREIATFVGGKYEKHWFASWLAVRIFVVLVIAHWYDSQVFADVAQRLASGHGIYAIGGQWRTSSFNGEGYFTYPPVYAYLLAVSGVFSLWFAFGSLVLKILIKLWLFLADFLVFRVLSRAQPSSARSYWTTWFVPFAAIGLLQSDVIVGLLVLLAFVLARSGRHVPAAVALGLGAATKYVPLLIVPFLCVYFFRARQKRVAAAYATLPVLTFAAAWLPYVLLYGDAWHFVDSVQYQGARIGGGMNALVLLHLVGFVLGLGNWIAGPVFDATNFIAALPLLTRLYSIIFAGVLITVLIWVSRQRGPSFEQAFLLPLMTFLFAAPLVNEQFIMMAFPILLLARRDIAKRLVVPFSAYFIAAGTPLRLLPIEIIGDANQVVVTGGSPVLFLPAVFVAIGTAVFFNVRLGGLLAGELIVRQQAAPQTPSLGTRWWSRLPSLASLRGFFAQRSRKLIAFSLVIVVACMAIGTAVFVGIQLHCPIEVHVVRETDMFALGAGSAIELEARNLGSSPRVLAFAATWSGLAIDEPWIAVDSSPVVSPGATQAFRLVPLRASGAIPSGTVFSMKVYYGSFENYCTTSPFSGPSFGPPLIVNPFLRYWTAGGPFGWTVSSQGDANDFTAANPNETAGLPTTAELIVNPRGSPATSDWAEIQIEQLIVDLPTELNVSLFPTFAPTTRPTMPTSGFGFMVGDATNRLWYVFGASAPAVYDYPSLRVVAIQEPLNAWSTYLLTRSDVVRNFAERGWLYHQGMDFSFFVAAHRSELGLHVGLVSVGNVTQ